MSALIIFDLDGTLADTEYEIAAMTADMAQAEGFELDAATAFRRYAGASFKDKFNMIAAEAGRSFTPERLADLHEDYKTRKRTLYKNPDIPAIPGAKSLVSRLSVDPNLTLSVGSSNERCRTRTVLSNIGLSQYFNDRVFGSDMTDGRKKPDPSIFHLAMAGHDPGETLVVEDSLVGITAAHAAGAFVVAYLDPRTVDRSEREQAYRDAGADMIIDNYDHFEEQVSKNWAGWPHPAP